MTVNLDSDADNFGGAEERLEIPITIAQLAGTAVDDYRVDGLDDWDAATGTGTLSFEIGDRYRTFEISAAQDDDSFDGALTVGFGEMPDAVSAGFREQAEVVLADDEPQIELSLDTQSVGEGDGQQTITVTAAFQGSATRQVDTVVSVSLAGGTATAGSDFTPVTSFDITIPNGDTNGSTTFAFDPTDDTASEQDETVVVSGTAGDLQVTSAALTITDNNDLRVALSVSPATVAEDQNDRDRSTTVTATIVNGSPPTTATEVTVSVGPGTAGMSADCNPGLDFVDPGPLTITIQPNASSAQETLTLQVCDSDFVAEPDETVLLSGTTSSGLAVLGTELTITDWTGATPPTHMVVDLETEFPRTVDYFRGRQPPVVSLSEGGGARQIRVVAGRFAAGNAPVWSVPTTVTVSVSSGTANASDDFAAVADFTIFIPGGRTYTPGFFTLQPVNDDLIEGSEKLLITATARNDLVGDITFCNAPKSDPNPFTCDQTPLEVTIVDNDPVVELRTSVTEVNEGTDEEVTVTAAFAAEQTLEVGTTVTVAFGASGDTATFIDDYTPKPEPRLSIPILAGAVSGQRTFTLRSVLDEEANEDEERLTLVGTATTDDAAQLEVRGTQMTIANVAPGDQPGTVTLSTTTPRVNKEVAATLSDPDGVVDGTERWSWWSSPDQRTPAWTNISGEASATYTPDADDIGHLLRATVTYDDNTGGGKTARSGPTQPVRRAQPQTQVLTVSFEAASYTTTEGDPDGVTVTVRLNQDADQDVLIPFTATLHEGTEADDYTVIVDTEAGDSWDTASATGTLRFAKGENERTFTIKAVKDEEVEEDETLTFIIDQLPTGVVVDEAANEATVTLWDNNNVVAFDETEYTVTEGGEVTVTVTLARAATKAVLIPLTATPQEGTEAGDYTLTVDPDAGDSWEMASGTGILRFAAGEAERTFTLTAEDDRLVEGAEALTMTLAADALPDGIQLDEKADTATITVVDNDTATVAIRAPDPAEVDEGDPAVFSVTLSAPVSRPVSVNYTLSGTANADDYTTPTEQTLSFEAEQTERVLEIPTLDDRLVEDDETLTVTLGAEELPANVALDEEADAATVTILDNDAARVRARIRRLNQEILSKHALNIADTVHQAIERRIGADPCAQPGPKLSLGGQSSLSGVVATHTKTYAEGQMSGARMLGDSSFELPVRTNPDAAQPCSGFTLWGSGNYLSLSGDRGPLDWSGDILGSQVGADMRLRPNLLVGMAASWSKGEFDYTDRTDGVTVDGDYTSRFTSLHPYLGWSNDHGLRLWATGGYGWGKIAIDDPEGGHQATDTTLKLITAGASGPLLSDPSLLPGGTTSLRLKGDSLFTRVEVDEDGLIDELTVDGLRFRLMLEGSYERELASGSRLIPSFELGLRHDGGDGDNGAGLEIGGGLRYLNPLLGLTLEGRGRVLTANHGYREWGAQVLPSSIPVQPAWAGG